MAPLVEGSLIQYVTAVDNNEAYYCDKSWKGGTTLQCGGGMDIGKSAGLWYFGANTSASYSHFIVGGRLCYKPTV